MYKEYKSLDLPAIDDEVRKYWEENEIFEKSISQRPKEDSFVFYEGPPSANGKPGIHHVMARTIKDLYCRYHTMKGKRVERKGGWDTHGLPIELAVEKELGITKVDIGSKITVDEYNAKCRETVMQYKDIWDDITRRMGYWVDLDNPYITYKNEYIESVWWLLKQLYSKDLMYKGLTVQPYSPAAGTGLSTAELNMPGCYKDVKDTTIAAQFKVVRDEKSAFLFEDEAEQVYFLAWTTTPWTLPSNTALTVGKKIDYVKIKTLNPYTELPVSVILANELVGKWFEGKGKPEIQSKSEFIKGADLLDIRYEQLLDLGNEIEDLHGHTDAFRVIPGNFVTTEDGTGIVHTAPSFGADDRVVAKDAGIGALTLVDKEGKFIPTAGEFSNRYVKNYKDQEDFKNVDIDIAIRLKTDNKAFNVAKYEHNYPHCWRTDKPILYYPLDSWFIKTSSMKERMFELNKTINWKPKSTGEGRFGKWLENLNDWNLSRTRFWGIPLPIWRTEDGSIEKCIGNIAELGAEIEKANAALGMNQEVPKDLHRPYIDDVVLVTEDGQKMTRELDLIDVWFDSGSMPYAQWHYPMENADVFERNYPADFIAEGVDQTRGWFYTLHAISTMVFDKVAYKNVVSNGLVLDKNGVKMSKRLGNAVDPFKAISENGADTNRWYMITNANPWDNLKFDEAGVIEVRNKFFGTLFNTFKFFSVYANIDKFVYAEDRIPVSDRSEIDQWVLSILNNLIKEVDADYADYEATKAGRKIQAFVEDHLSNWYVRLNRKRFWKGEYSQDKIAAYQTLYDCMLTVSKLMAPISPFFADWLYKNLNEATKQEAHESVHLALMPTADESAIQASLEEQMNYAQRICSLVLSLRKKEQYRVRQPLQKIMLPVLNPEFKMQVNAVADLILAETNVKEIEFLEDTAGVISKKIKPNFKTLGKRMGKDMKVVAQAVGKFTQDDITKVEKDKFYDLDVNGTMQKLTLEDFEISADDIPGLLVANDADLTVALDVSMTDELRAEGMARELVNRIQTIRKDKDFNVTDRIVIEIEKQDGLESAVTNFGVYIMNEVLADGLVMVDNLSTSVQVELPEEVKAWVDVNLV